MYEPKLTTITIEKSNFNQPVFADLITGKIYLIPKKNWTKTGNTIVLKNIPVPDYPILITDKSIL
jgi:hypothetical protein